MKPLLEKYLRLDHNTSGSTQLALQRQKDHYSHFILRLAFASTEDLRRRFTRVETMLFRLRFAAEDTKDRKSFVEGLNLDWEMVSEDERRQLATQLSSATFYPRNAPPEDETWCKVDWERVPDLIERRRVFLQAGMAYVPSKEQSSMVLAEYTSRLERALEVRATWAIPWQGRTPLTELSQLTARGLPRLDEDDRLSPILDHLSKNFITPDASYQSGSGDLPEGAEITAHNIDNLSQHFPACMSHLHRSLRRDAHLKHFGRLQYTLFLKGVGLNLEEALTFWRQSFNKITDDQFNKDYRYNVRHAYGDVGGDSNRRGNGYSPFSCQKILTEHPPGPGEAHGCPYRHFNLENLNTLVQSMGVSERSVLQGVKDDKDKQKFHMACNR